MRGEVSSAATTAIAQDILHETAQSPHATLSMQTHVVPVYQTSLEMIEIERLAIPVTETATVTTTAMAGITVTTETTEIVIGIGRGDHTILVTTETTGIEIMIPVALLHAIPPHTATESRTDPAGLTPLAEDHQTVDITGMANEVQKQEKEFKLIHMFRESRRSRSPDRAYRAGSRSPPRFPIFPPPHSLLPFLFNV